MLNMTGEGRATERAEIICRTCKRKVVSFVKCVNCDSYYHSGCAKKLKLPRIGEKLTKCCTNSDFEDDKTDGFFEALENLSTSSDNKIDINIFKYVIRQKNVLINELNDKIKLLNQMLDITTQQMRSEFPKKMGIPLHVSSEDTGLSKYSSPVAEPAPVSEEDSNLISDKTGQNSECAKIDSKSKVQQSKDKTESSSNKNNDWHKVTHKKNTNHRKFRPSLVVGSYDGTSDVSGIERRIAFHVSNLKPETTIDNIRSFLNKNFKDVGCEAIKSKRPNEYASFKVTLLRSEKEKALDATNWPNNASVRYFFHRKVENQPICFPGGSTVLVS